MRVCISTNALLPLSRMNNEQLLSHESIRVNSFSSNTYCECSSRATQSFSLMPTVWQLPASHLAVFPLRKRWPFGTHRRKNETISTIVSLFWLWEIMVENHTKGHASLWHSHTHTTLQWVGDPSSFSRAASGTQHQEKSYNCLISEPLVEESDRDIIKMYWWLWEKEKKD